MKPVLAANFAFPFHFLHLVAHVEIKRGWSLISLFLCSPPLPVKAEDSHGKEFRMMIFEYPTSLKYYLTGGGKPCLCTDEFLEFLPWPWGLNWKAVLDCDCSVSGASKRPLDRKTRSHCGKTDSLDISPGRVANLEPQTMGILPATAISQVTLLLLVS